MCSMQAKTLEHEKAHLEGLLQEREGAAMEVKLKADILQARVADLEASVPSDSQQSQQVRFAFDVSLALPAWHYQQ